MAHSCQNVTWDDYNYLTEDHHFGFFTIVLHTLCLDHLSSGLLYVRGTKMTPLMMLKDHPAECRGVYNCAGCGTPIYKSGTKFSSGCGWPAFFEGLPGAINRTVSVFVFCFVKIIILFYMPRALWN